jgi:recombination protein U
MGQQTEWKKFENSIKKTNYKYRKDTLAVIEYHEIPVKGNILKQSTVDFTGVYGPNGKGIAFDAKQTGEAKRFPLSNMKQHQVEFLRYWDIVGGEAYVFIQFYNVQGFEEFYMAPISLITNYWDKRGGGRKSIPIEDFKDIWKRQTKDYLKLYENNNSANGK